MLNLAHAVELMQLTELQGGMLTLVSPHAKSSRSLGDENRLTLLRETRNHHPHRPRRTSFELETFLFIIRHEMSVIGLLLLNCDFSFLFLVESADFPPDLNLICNMLPVDGAIDCYRFKIDERPIQR